MHPKSCGHTLLPQARRPLWSDMSCFSLTNGSNMRVRQNVSRGHTIPFNLHLRTHFVSKNRYSGKVSLIHLSVTADTLCLQLWINYGKSYNEGTVIPAIGLCPHVLDPLAVDIDWLRSLVIKCKRILRNAWGRVLAMRKTTLRPKMSDRHGFFGLSRVEAD
jgi:hypothetical protein